MPKLNKAARKALKRRARNRSLKSFLKTLLKKAQLAISEKNLAEAKDRVIQAVSALDKAARKGVIHKNKAARHKSRLTSKLHSLSQETSAQP